MQETPSVGEWFLPGSALRIPGRLLYDQEERKIVLELLGHVYLDGEPVIKNPAVRDKKYHSDRFNQDYKRSVDLVLGEARELLTLYHCEVASVQLLGKGIYAIRYTVHFVFYDVHVPALEELSVVSSRLQFPFVGGWYDGDKSMDKADEFDQRGFSEFDAGNKELPSQPIPIRTDLELVFVDHFEKRWKKVGRHRELMYQKFVEFHYKRPVSWGMLLQDAAVFKKLLEFSLGRPLKCMLTKIRVDPQTEGPAEVPVWNTTLHEGEDVDKPTEHQRYMLISNWVMDQIELQQVLKKWYANEAFYSMYDFYLDSNNWFQRPGGMQAAILSNVMFNNRFLNIVHGLDAYYKIALKQSYLVEEEHDHDTEKATFEARKTEVMEILKKKGNPALTTWMNAEVQYKMPAPRLQPGIKTILDRILLSLEQILTPIFGQAKIRSNFPVFAAGIRDPLSHGEQTSTYQGPTLLSYFHFGQIVLACCTLRSLEVQEIADKIGRYSPFSEYILEIRSAEKNR
jgi:hypothetical protein